MNKLTDINLAPEGIIVFGARPGMGLTRTVLKLSNILAESETVVFISYQDYKEQLEYNIKLQGSRRCDSLILNTSLKFCDYAQEYANALQEIIDKQHPKTIIIDDLDSMLGEDQNYYDGQRDELILELNKIAECSHLRIVLNVTVSNKVEIRGGDKRPLIRDFTWSRNLVHEANEVYTLYCPAYYGMTLDENGESLSGIMEIALLKGGNKKERHFTLSCVDEMLYAPQ